MHEVGGDGGPGGVHVPAIRSWALVWATVAWPQEGQLHDTAHGTCGVSQRVAAELASARARQYLVVAGAIVGGVVLATAHELVFADPTKPSELL